MKSTPEMRRATVKSCLTFHLCNVQLFLLINFTRWFALAQTTLPHCYRRSKLFDENNIIIVAMKKCGSTQNRCNKGTTTRLKSFIVLRL